MQIVTPMPDPCQKHPAVVLRTCFVSHQLYQIISNLQSWLYNVWQRLFSPHLFKNCNKSSGRQFSPPTYYETYAGPKITPTYENICSLTKTHINIFHLLLSLFVKILKSVCFSFDWIPKLIQNFFQTMEQKLVQRCETTVVRMLARPHNASIAFLIEGKLHKQNLKFSEFQK